MTEILDTIDHVLDDYDTSADAMRWTPDPQPQELPITAAMEEMAATLRRTAVIVQRTMAKLRESLTPFLEAVVKANATLIRLQDQQKDQVRSQRHAEYRRRQLARRRRNRR